MYSMNGSLSPAERALFDDAAIEAAFQAWAGVQVSNNQTLNLRKRFLLRIRALAQAGKI